MNVTKHSVTDIPDNDIDNGTNKVNDSARETSKYDEAENSHQHPLRILSEENLSVVSTFVSDNNDLASGLEEDEDIDPSKFPFFTVPDFGNCNENSDQYFECRLRDLQKIGSKTNETLTNDEKTVNSEAQTQARPDCYHSSFNDPRFLYGDYKQMSTFSDTDGGLPRPSVSGLEERAEEEIITPQKQFLLLSQSLRLPDGSSNPDMFDPDPGTDRNENLISEVTDPGGLSLVVTQDLTHTKKSELTFAGKLWRLFSSKRNKKEKRRNTIDKRSKSCDRDLEESCKKENKKLEAIRSASCSPVKARHNQTGGGTSCLSLVPTEWEYSHLQDTLNGNTRLTDPPPDRKSSGYDSLEGENSSIDSSHEVCDGFIKFNGNTLRYAVPSDNKNHERVLDYDDISALKDEIRRYPNILRRAY